MPRDSERRAASKQAYLKRNREKILNKKRAQYQRDREAVLAYQKKRYLENRDIIDSKKKAYELAHPEMALARACKRFGITLETFEAMLKQQNYVCKICHKPNPSGNRLSIDHDHKCCPKNKSCGLCVRGLLCERCNMGIGVFQDDPLLLREASDYLSIKPEQKFPAPEEDDNE